MKIKSRYKTATFARSAERPELETVFETSTPFGPGDITSNPAVRLNANTCEISIIAHETPQDIAS